MDTSMEPPVVRGYAELEISAEDGMTTVTMLASRTAALGRNVLARSVSAQPVRVEPGLRLTGTGTRRSTQEVVDMVTSAAGQITLRAPR